MNMLIKVIEFIWLMLPAYLIYKVWMFVLDAIDILQERHKTLSYTLPYLSYDNRLICLHKGPDSRGRLNVPEGIESIDEHAFDDFLVRGMHKKMKCLKKGISAIVFPSTIKELNIDNIPDGTTLAFADARSKSILRGSEDDLEYREIKIKGRLFVDVLKECETLEHKKQKKSDDEFPEVPNILDPDDIERINDALSKIADPSLKIKLMDRFHALILSGDMSIPDFKYLLMCVNFEPKDRYYGTDVIERIYGSVEDAYVWFETKYYESENIRKQEAAAERTQTCAPGKGPEWTCEKNVFKTIDLVESVAKDPTAFLTDKVVWSEVQGDDIDK